MEVLIVRPERDIDERTMSVWGAGFAAAVAARPSVNVTDLRGQTGTVRRRVLPTLRGKDVLAYFGHGRPDNLGGAAMILDTNDTTAMSKLTVAAIACHAGTTLGPHLVANGVAGFLGFDDLLVIYRPAGSIYATPIEAALMDLTGPGGTTLSARNKMAAEFRHVRDSYRIGTHSRHPDAPLIWLGAHCNSRTCVAF